VGDATIGVGFNIQPRGKQRNTLLERHQKWSMPANDGAAKQKDFLHGTTLHKIPIYISTLRTVLLQCWLDCKQAPGQHAEKLNTLHCNKKLL